MKKVLIILFSCFFVITAQAKDDGQLLNQVVLNLKAEQWVTTDTAKVRVNINASLDKGQLAKVHADILRKLTQLSNKGAWHITSFNRSQDRSGLEQLRVVAEARLPEKALANLRDQAKSLSKPGFILTITNINFIPNLAAFEQVRSKLRTRLYSEARAELQRLNSVYPGQHYFLHSIDFTGKLVAMPLARANTIALAYKAEAATPALRVGNKEMLFAAVVLASRTING